MFIIVIFISMMHDKRNVILGFSVWKFNSEIEIFIGTLFHKHENIRKSTGISNIFLFIFKMYDFTIMCYFCGFKKINILMHIYGQKKPVQLPQVKYVVYAFDNDFYLGTRYIFKIKFKIFLYLYFREG